MNADGGLSAHRADAAVEVVAHEHGWAAQFDEEAGRLRVVLEALSPSVEHIGSTAVEGLPAKPTIDLLVLVDGVREVLTYVEQLAELGYDYRPASLTSSDDQLFFRKVASTGKRTHHLHVVARRSPKGQDYLAFRDYLRVNEDEARRYAEVKLELAHRFASERMRYVDEKATYVDDLMERVRLWASEGGR